MKRALITGVTGQDGSYLAELLLAKGYEVHGLVARSSMFNRHRIDHLVDPEGRPLLHLHYGDMVDGISITNLVRTVSPTEIYHLAAQSHVGISFEMPEYTAEAIGLGTLRLLEAARGLPHEVRFFNASTSELFTATPPPQDERTPMFPTSPYGAAKQYAHVMTSTYRTAHGMFAASGILFNHESPRRGENFVTRKITLGVAKIKLGVASDLHLGNLAAVRDWGWAPEYVEAMWQVLQHDEPDDFVLATGKGRTVEDFCASAFAHADLDWRDHVVVDQAYTRPADQDIRVGDPTKAQAVLGWRAEADGEEVARRMVDADLEQVARLLGR